MDTSKFWKIMVILIILSTCLVTFIGRKNIPLMGYIDKETGKTEETTKDIQKELKTYTTEKTKLSIGIPKEFEELNKNGHPIFMHKPSASAIEIWERKYEPDIIKVSPESVSTSLTANGYIFNNFQWINNHAYVSTYTDKNKETGKETNYIKLDYFDKENIIEILYTINSDYYEDCKELIGASLDTIKWEAPNPINEKLILRYNDFGNFQFAVPIDWNVGTKNNAFFAQSKDGAIMSISVSQSDKTYESASQIDYVNFASRGRNNFALRSYNADSNIIRGTAVYINNGQQYMMMQNLIAPGNGYEYNITFECPMKIYDSQEKLYTDAFQLFRIY